MVEALIASAAELFAERGIEGASVREVAANAGVNHALVFRHFGSKQRLVRVVLDRQLDGLLARFRNAGLDPAALSAVGESIADNELLWKLLTRAVLDGEIDFVTERSFSEIELVIARMEGAGVLPDGVDARTMLAIVLAAGLGWALLDPVLPATIGVPGATPARRRDLAREAFAGLIGLPAPGVEALSPSEARAAEVPREMPAFGPSPPQAEQAASGPPRGREQVSRALVTAAMEMFAARGHTAVSVREVAARAGVNHALVFRHFGSKDGLVRAVRQRAAEDLAGRMVGGPNQQSFRALTETLAEDETLWRLVARAILDGDVDTLTAHPYHFVDASVWATARAQEAGMVETRIHPRLIVGMVFALGLGWMSFHPVLIPLLGLPESEPAEHRDRLRAAVGVLLGWHDAPRLGGRDH